MSYNLQIIVCIKGVVFVLRYEAAVELARTSKETHDAWFSRHVARVDARNAARKPEVVALMSSSDDDAT